MTRAARHISSVTNALVQEIARIGSSAKERRIHQRTLIDGPHLVQMFSARGGCADVLVASESGMRNPEVASLFEQCPADRRVICSDRVFERVSPVESPVGLLAIIAIPAPASPKEPWTDGVLLDAIQDAGNVGAILRITAAAGIRRVAIAKGSADAWSPKVLRAGMGAHFGLSIHSHDDLSEIATMVAGAVIVGSSDATRSLYDVDLRGPVVWTFGAEGQGVSAAMRALATMEVRIPMAPGSESLNVAAAAAICLFEQARQRRG